ncbi:MAG: hypothetical protein J6Z41_07615 [Prevotella sp.]|nr:hypothetical protein [Prevotella sp.]
MKKFLLSAAAVVVAMSANAQVLQINADEALGLSGDLLSLSKDTEIGTIEGAITAFVPFDDSYKMLDCKNDGYNQVEIDGNIILTKGGMQGNTNPKDADGNAPANSLKAPAGGAVIGLSAAKDGYVYIVSKLSSNKQYTVFEEGSPIGYELSMEFIDDHVPSGVLGYKLDGEGEYNIIPVSQAPIDWVERIALNIPSHEEEVDGAMKVVYDYEIKKNGLGVIVFPVAKDCSYMINASGSKISWSGLYFAEEKAEKVTVSDSNGETTPKDILGASATGINNMKFENVFVENAPIYNLAGQKVSKSYKGIVIQNGRKFINK